MNNIEQQPLKDNSIARTEFDSLTLNKPKEAVLLEIDYKKNWRMDVEYTSVEMGVVRISERGQELLDKIFRPFSSTDIGREKALKELYTLIQHSSKFAAFECDVECVLSKSDIESVKQPHNFVYSKTVKVYGICLKENITSACEYIKHFANRNNGSGFELPLAVCKSYSNAGGWYMMRNDLIFFIDKIMFENFSKILMINSK